MARVRYNSNLLKPSKFVNLMTDYGFKLAFGDSELLIHFLNSLFEKDNKVVKSVRYLNKEITSTHQHGRTIYYDVLCKIEGEEDVIIEMQHQSQDTFGERALYYMSNSIVKQGDNKSNWRYKLHSVYGVFIMNFNLSGKNVPDEVVNEVNLTYKKTNAYFTDKFRMFFIDLPRFNKTEEELDSNLDCWIYNIKNMGTMTATPKMAEKKPFAKLFSRAEVAVMTPRERQKYEDSLKVYRDSLAVEETYRNEKKRAREEGLAEGREEGRAEGRAEGLAEGRAEGRIEEKIAIAKSLKASNVDIDTIKNATGLSIEEINAL